MKITLNPSAKDAATRDALVAEGGFGKYYTDHMVICEWDEKNGWAEPELVPYGPLTLDPATAVFHYGQEIFEGMKAYRQPDGGIALFRPEANAKRFARSAARLALPEMPVELFIETVETLVKQDANVCSCCDGCEFTPCSDQLAAYTLTFNLALYAYSYERADRPILPP
jgi:branched-chain amino acid aminotransferase